MKDKNRYYKDIKKMFPVNGKKEKIYLKKIKEQIDEYDKASYEDLENQFGSPIEIVKSYYDTIDSQYLLKRINIKRIVSITCVFVLTIVCLYFGYRTYILNKAYEDFHSSIPVEYEEVIEVID